MRVPLLTSYWPLVLQYAKDPEEHPGFVPVNIAVGAPRGVKWARNVPRIAELAPYGLLKKPRLPAEKFEEGYRTRITNSGVDAIQARFLGIWTNYGKLPLVLLCWEPPGEPCHRRQFAEWWLQETGQVIPEAPGLDVLSITKVLKEVE